MRPSLSLLFILLIVNISCKRDHLYYATNDKAIVNININWEESKLSPNGVTALAYHHAGALYKQFPPFSNPDSITIELPEGNFDILLFNNTPSEYKYINFNNLDKITTVTASSKEAVAAELMKDSQNSTFIGANPDTLASTVIENVNITQLEIDYSYYKPDINNINSAITLEATPQRRIYVIDMNAHILGLKSVAEAPVTQFYYSSSGYLLGAQTPTTSPAIQEFKLNNRIFDSGSTTDGSLTAEFTSFGPLKQSSSDSTCLVFIDFTLINGEKYPVTIDVTDKMQYFTGYQPRIVIDFDVELPTLIGGSGGSGFSPNVNIWDETEVEIPL